MGDQLAVSFTWSVGRGSFLTFLPFAPERNIDHGSALVVSTMRTNPMRPDHPFTVGASDQGRSFEGKMRSPFTFTLLGAAFSGETHEIEKSMY